MIRICLILTNVILVSLAVSACGERNPDGAAPGKSAASASVTKDFEQRIAAQAAKKNAEEAAQQKMQAEFEALLTADKKAVEAAKRNAEEAAQKRAEEAELRRRKETVISAEANGKHDEALEILDTMNPLDPWVTGFRASIEMMQDFDEVGVEFVNWFSEDSQRIQKWMQGVEDGSIKEGWEVLDQLKEQSVADNDAWKKKLPLAFATLRAAIKVAPDNKLPRLLLKQVGEQEQVELAEVYVALGFFYQFTGRVDHKFLRDALAGAKRP